MSKVKRFKNDNFTCECASVPVDKSMMILSKENKLLEVHHKDCPKHGWHEIEKEAIAITS